MLQLTGKIYLVLDRRDGGLRNLLNYLGSRSCGLSSAVLSYQVINIDVLMLQLYASNKLANSPR
jgi:hypothetical protein